jgi:hypothetical protein
MDFIKNESKLSPLIKMRVLQKNSQLDTLSFNGFCNGGFGLGGFPLLRDKGMHSPPSDLGGMIYSP